ncbi:MAG: bifunctional nuclease family protein [Limnochordia bacterium]|nr:bifunctional nuclease family protein [Limnochordia bacterium]MDD2628776.1 bifunctional nuclease family protein [Limnochordia bacterium]
MIRMKVKVVGVDQRSMLPVVVITDTQERGFIPIVIGPAEANAITIQLEGIQPPRPITHDLITSIIEAFGAKIVKIAITDLRDETYYARIYIETAKGQLDIDARPSDAIALALRTNCPIYITEQVAAKAMVNNKPIDDEEIEQFKQMLDNLTPDDFKKNLH